MTRAVLGLLALLFASCCQLPSDRLPLPPLPENSQPLPYAELLTRARMQASAATEAFYVGRWSDLNESAAGMEQTGRFLTKATEVPAKHRATLVADAGNLLTEAGKLRDAAKAQDVKRSNETLQRLNLLIRELRLED